MFMRVYDGSISGHLEMAWDGSPEEAQEYLQRISGRWTDDFGDGAVLLSSEWSAWLFTAKPDEADPYPDFVVTPQEITPA